MLRKLIIVSLLLVTLCTATFAARQTKTPMMLGFLAYAPPSSVATTALSTAAGAAGWNTAVTGDCILCSASGIAFSVIPAASCQVSKFKAYASAENGTVVAADMRAALWADNAGVGPNTGSAAIEEKAASADQTGAGWQEYTGFTATSTLTAGTQYWVVLRNGNAAPTANYTTYRYGTSTSGPALVTANAHGSWGMNKVATTDSGQNWTAPSSAQIGTSGWRIECSDGTFLGIPTSNIAIAGTADYIYGTREEGVKFQLPANATFNIIGAMFPIGKLGTPGQPLYYRLYSGSGATGSLLASTTDIPIANVTTSRLWATAYFATAQAITGGTTLRIVAGHHGAGGDTSNAYRFDLYDIDNTSGSKALLCYAAAGCQKTLTTTGGDGASFTDTDTQTPAFGLLLDTTGEFVAPVTTGGGIIGG